MTIHTPITKPSWQDRVTYARANEALGPLHIAAIRDEALALIGPGHCDNAINRAIATACQGYLDCVGYPDDCAQYLDEIDALLFDEPCEPEWAEFNPSMVHPNDPCQSKGWS